MLGQENSLGRKWQPTPVFLPGKSHGQKYLADYSPWSWERVGYDWATKTFSDTTICSIPHPHPTPHPHPGPHHFGSKSLFSSSFLSPSSNQLFRSIDSPLHISLLLSIWVGPKMVPITCHLDYYNSSSLLTSHWFPRQEQTEFTFHNARNLLEGNEFIQHKFIKNLPRTRQYSTPRWIRSN